MKISAKMAGLPVPVRVKELEKRLSRAKAALEDMTPLWRSVGEYMVKRTMANFNGEHAPDGTPWKPLSQKRVDQRKKRHDKGRNKKRAGQMKILSDTGELKKSVRADPSKDGVVVGAYRKYARIHQFGGNIAVTPKMRAFLHYKDIHLRKETQSIRIPARPFIGAAAGDIETIKGMARAYAGRYLK